MSDIDPMKPDHGSGPPEPSEPQFADPGHQALSESLRSVFKLVPIGMGIILAMFLATGVYRVKPDEWAVRLRFGRFVSKDDSGWYVGMPYPVDVKVKLPRRSLLLDLDAFWYGKRLQREKEREPTTAQAFGLAPTEDGYIITGDRQIVHVMCNVTYRIDDPLKFYRNVGGEELFPVAQRQEPSRELNTFLRAVTMPAIRRVMARYTIDEIYQTAQRTRLSASEITVPMFEAIYGDEPLPEILEASFATIEIERQAQRGEIVGAVMQAIQDEFDRLDTGLVLTDFGFNAEPPVGVNVAFSDVIRASTIRGTRVSQAEIEASNIERDARQRAARLNRDAQIYRKTVVASAAARADQVRRLDEEYGIRDYRRTHGDAYPPALAAFMELRRIETLRDLVQNAREIFLVSADPDNPSKEVRLHLNRDPQAMKAYRDYIERQREEAERRQRLFGGTNP